MSWKLEFDLHNYEPLAKNLEKKYIYLNVFKLPKEHNLINYKHSLKRYQKNYPPDDIKVWLIIHKELISTEDITLG